MINLTKNRLLHWFLGVRDCKSTKGKKQLSYQEWLVLCAFKTWNAQWLQNNSMVWAKWRAILVIFSSLSNLRRWNANMSAMLPEDSTSPGKENVVFVVAILRSANPNTCSTKCLKGLLHQNRLIVEAATNPRIGAKQYLPHYSHQGLWSEHFGGRWNRFLARKSKFDPLHILAPGQGIFSRVSPHSTEWPTNIWWMKWMYIEEEEEENPREKFQVDSISSPYNTVYPFSSFY